MIGSWLNTTQRRSPGQSVLLGSLFVAVALLQACASTDGSLVPPVFSAPDPRTTASAVPGSAASILKVMTLNMAHSRGEGFHQLFQDSATARANLNAIGGLVNRERPNLVALQEADGPSFWSGGFDHVAYLAHNYSLSQYVQGEHARGLGLSYGTALMSELPLRDPVAVTFDPALSLTPKGFVVSAIAWPDDPSLQVDVASLHLDPLSDSTRRRQATELIETLRNRERPLILMGDFNTEWGRENSVVKFIAEALGLKACNPRAPEMATFPAFAKRLDWILVSPELDFVSHVVLPDAVSDHRAVVALITLAGRRESNPICSSLPLPSHRSNSAVLPPLAVGVQQRLDGPLP